VVERHSLLQRQIERHLGDAELPPAVRELLEAVNESYHRADSDRQATDADRQSLRRTLELASRELLEADSEMRAVFHAIPDLFFRLDGTGRILECSAGHSADLCLPAEELVGKRLQDFPPHEAAERFADALRDVAATGEGVSIEYSIGHGPRTRHYEARILPLAGEQRIVLVRNMTEQQRAKDELQESLSLLRATLESTADGIVVMDSDRRIVAYNQKFAEIWDLDPEMLEGLDSQAALAKATELVERPEAFLARIRELYAQPDASSKDVLELRDGRVIERYSQPQRIDGRSVGRVWSFRDVTQQHQAEATIRHRAYHDDLTGLPNRLLFHDRFAQALGHARRHKQTLALLFLDLDRFKTINDTLGHAVGDQLLKHVAQRLTTLTRAGDTCARMSGDEFTLLISSIRQVDDASTVAEHVLNAIRQPFRIEGHELHVSVSVGISIYPFDGEDTETLMKHADVALYRAKETGRNTYEVYSPALNEAALERLTLGTSLRHAVDREEFLLEYQPQVDVVSGKVVGSEVLVRWVRPDGTVLPPAQFVPVAEDTGLIVRIGDWVLQKACAQAQAWRAAGLPPVQLAVNLSAQQFQRPNLVADVGRILDETGLDPRALELELTESAIMLNPEMAVSTLRRLRSMGVGIAVDDFGTGYSSLSYLRKLPISALKIDRSFVRDCLHNPDDAAIVTAVLSMARSLRLKVVAEGVETAEQMAFLRERGCHEMQGYFFGTPRNAAAFADLVTGPAAWVA
jgi:diguanylate cyclase (GGDEF)-like protein/PAS domain S-box-containing protein